MAWGLDVKHPRSLASCLRRTPTLSVKICVKKCVLYTRNYGRPPPNQKNKFITSQFFVEFSTFLGDKVTGSGDLLMVVT